MSDNLVTQQDFDDANEHLARVLVDANIDLNPFGLIMLRLDMIQDILLDHRIISPADLDLKWAMFLHEHLSGELGRIQAQAETVERETHE